MIVAALLVEMLASKRALSEMSWADQTVVYSDVVRKGSSSVDQKVQLTDDQKVAL